MNQCKMQVDVFEASGISRINCSHCNKCFGDSWVEVAFRPEPRFRFHLSCLHGMCSTGHHMMSPAPLLELLNQDVSDFDDASIAAAAKALSNVYPDERMWTICVGEDADASRASSSAVQRLEMDVADIRRALDRNGIH